MMAAAKSKVHARGFLGGHATITRGRLSNRRSAWFKKSQSRRALHEPLKVGIRTADERRL